MPENLKLLGEVLTSAGYAIRPVKSGPKAISASLSKPPDLILLDIRMPGMNGFETAEHLKSNPQTNALPIIFISALTDVEEKVKAFKAGGVDYINKPFHQEEVLARVETHLSLTRLYRRLKEQNVELQKALVEVKTLRGMIPICANCKKVRDDAGYWNRIEDYIRMNSEAEFSHSICPDCVKKLYPDLQIANDLDSVSDE